MRLNLTNSRRLLAAVIPLLFLASSEASAAPTCQGAPPNTPVINATSISFLASPDNLYVSVYRIGLFVKGATPSDTNAITRQDVAKSQFIEVPGEPGCLSLTLTSILLGTPIQSMLEYVGAVKVIVEPTSPFDSFESAWTGASNSFLKSASLPRPASAPRMSR